MKITTSIQKAFFILLTGLYFASNAQANPQIMSAPEAQAAVKAGKMLLIDIRSEEEWVEDGIAEGAFPVSMHSLKFGQHLSRILEQRGDRQLGMICATGGRTKYVAMVMNINGVTDLVDVSEGMHGNHNGPGWLARKLPVVKMEDALKLYQDTIK